MGEGVFKLRRDDSYLLNCTHIKKNDYTVFLHKNYHKKIPFKYSKPLIKVYKDNKLFNYYHLAKGMEIICLLNLSKLWVNFKNEINKFYILKLSKGFLCVLKLSYAF